MSPKLPPQAQLARWAVKYGPLVLPYAKRLYEQGRFRQLAIMHARTLEDGSFSWEMVDGERVWVVWTGDEVVAVYPDTPSLRSASGDPFPAARIDRRQDPDDLPTPRAKQRLAEMSWPWRRGDVDADGTDERPGRPRLDAAGADELGDGTDRSSEAHADDHPSSD